MSVTELPVREAEGDLGRALPADIRAEQCVLGGMLLSAAVIDDVTAAMDPGDHFRPAHQTIHRVILEMNGRGDPVDAITLNGELARCGEAGSTGGPMYLHTLISAVPIAANAAHYARIVRERAIFRRLVEVGTRIVQLGYSGGGDPSETADRARMELDAVLDLAAPRETRTMPDIVATVLDRIETGTERGIQTPWDDINDVVPGLADGEFIVIGGRPGDGKSIVGVQMAWHAAKAGVPTLIVSMEMTGEDQVMRLIASDAKVDLSALLRSHVQHDADWLRIGESAAALSNSLLEIEDAPLQTVAQIRSRMRKMAGRQKCGLVVVDYLGLVHSLRTESRQQAVAQVSRDLKQLARSEKVPVVALAQLNRDSAKGLRRPVQSDLRDSGQIEADADMVFLLYQPPENPGVLEVIIEKQRQGPNKVTVELTFQGHYARAVNSAWTPHGPEGGR